MDCSRAQELMPELVLETLKPEDMIAVREHVDGGCSQCNQEYVQLLEASSLLGETLQPVLPRADLKHELLETLSSESQISRANSTLSSRANDNFAGRRTRGRSFWPYVAASLLAIAAGALFANFSGAPSGDGEIAEGALRLREQWEESIAAAQEAFGPPQAQLIGFDHDMQGRQLKASLFYDGIAKQLHVLVSQISQPSEGRQAYLWLLDGNKKVLADCPLMYVGEKRATAIIDLPELPRDLAGAVITEETEGQPTAPEGPVLGRATLRQTT